MAQSNYRISYRNRIAYDPNILVGVWVPDQPYDTNYYARHSIALGEIVAAAAGLEGITGIMLPLVGGQGAAAEIIYSTVIVNECPPGGGLILPPDSYFSRRVVNFSANIVRVFPHSGGNIKGLIANAYAEVFTGGQSVGFNRAEATPDVWYPT